MNKDNSILFKIISTIQYPILKYFTITDIKKLYILNTEFTPCVKDIIKYKIIAIDKLLVYNGIKYIDNEYIKSLFFSYKINFDRNFSKRFYHNAFLQKILFSLIDDEFDKYTFSLNLSWSNIKNLNPLSRLKNIDTLDLSWCKALSDLNALKNININKVELVSCENIIDVSPLSNVNNLILRFCDSIVDVSSLGKVTILDLSYCTSIKDVSSLKNVSSLNLTGCSNIKNFNLLSNVKKI
jgi:hypothetical protein